MNTASRENNRFLIYAVTAGLIITVLFVAGFLSVAGAQPEPEKPPFAGVLVEPEGGRMPKTMAPVDEDNLGPEWRPIFAEDFESASWEEKWDANLDLSPAPSVGRKWGTQLVGNTLDPMSTKSGWGICADATCSTTDPIAPSYPKGIVSWLVAGPFDLSKADDALVNLDLFYEASNGDPFTVSVSENRVQFTPQLTVDGNVNQGAWEEKSVSLSQFAGNPNKTRLWIAFTFSSDSNAQKIGAMVDNISVWTEGEPGYYLPYVAYGFTPTPVPVTPTATPPPPGGDYRDGFANNIDGWLDRRATFGTTFSLTHDGDSVDGGRSGFLNALVNTGDSHYMIASPLVQAKAVPYNIETVVKMRSKRETGDQYGIVFGGNFDPAAGDCRAPATGVCFTQYYEVRVRFYYDEQDDKDRMEVKIKRIDSVDENNNSVGPDLTDWERVPGVDEDDFIEWDVTYSRSGKISVSANKNPVPNQSVTDTTYINNPYFGIIVRTESKPDSEVRYDYIKVD